jgi:DNA-binding response OmpR family regulator
MCSTILAIDEDDEVLKLYDMLFSFEGHTVVTCKTPHSAFDLALEHNPDCIFLDLPVSDARGTFALAQRLKTDSRTANIPLVFVTKSTNVEEQTHAFIAGAIDIIAKPFKLKEVLEQTRSTIELGRLQKLISKVLDKL